LTRTRIEIVLTPRFAISRDNEVLRGLGDNRRSQPGLADPDTL